MKIQVIGSVATFLIASGAHAQVSESAELTVTIQKGSTGTAISLTKFQDIRFSQDELIEGNTNFTSPINTFCVYSETPTFTVEVTTIHNGQLIDAKALADPDALKLHYTMGLSEIAEDGSVIQFLDFIDPGHAPEVIDINGSMRGENCDTGNNIGLDLGVQKLEFNTVLDKMESDRDYEFVDTITLTIAPNL